MTRFSLPKPKSVKDPVIPSKPIYGDYTPSSTVDVYAKPSRQSALDKVINSDLSTESRNEFFTLFPSPDKKFGADDIRYVASKKYPELDLTNVPKKEIVKIISQKNLKKFDQSQTKSEKIIAQKEAQWQDPQSGYRQPGYVESVGAPTAAAKQKNAASEIAKIKANPDLMTASYIDSISDQSVKYLVRNEFSHLFPDLYHGKFESKAAEQAFKGLQLGDPEIRFGRGHLIQKMLAGEVKGLKVDRPQFPTETTLNNFHDVFNSFLDQAKIKREKAIEKRTIAVKEQRLDDVKVQESNIKTIEDNVKRVENFITELFLESPIKGQKKTDILSPYPEGASIQYKINEFKKNYKDAINKLPDIKEKFYELRNEFDKLNLFKGGYVRPNMSIGGDMAQFTEMESVVPDLNPAEAGMEDYTQLAMASRFKNPFKKVDPPPIMSDAPSGLKITDKTKAGAKIEGTIKTEGQTPVFHLKSDLELAGAVQDKMTPQQWFGYLTKKGVSETEMHEFGLGNLLKNIGGFDEGTKKWKNNASITKAELISQYKNNKPVITYKIQQMEPFEKGWKDFQSFLTGQRGGANYIGDMPASAREFEELRRLKNKPQDIIGDRLRTTIVKFAQEISDRTGRDIKTAWSELDPKITSNINNIIKEAYGIENVVENGFGNVKVPFYTQNLVNRFRRLKKGEGFYMGKTGVGHEGAQFLKGGTGYIEIPFTYNPNPKGARANEPRFTFGQGHFTNPKGNNPVFWLRASERVDERGKRVFLIEEIQSDMHQKVKQKPDTFKYSQRHDAPGFMDQTHSLAQVKKLKDDLVKVSDQIDKITGHTDPSAVTVMERLKVKREALRNQIRESEDLISQAAGKSDELFPEGPWKKSENQAKIAIKTLINLATDQGFDSVAIISGKAKNHAVSASSDIAKGNRGFYDNIAVSGMKNVAKNLDLEFSSTNIKDGDGNTWAKIPIINLKKEPVKASVDMYKSEGGFIYRPSFVDVVPVL